MFETVNSKGFCEWKVKKMWWKKRDTPYDELVLINFKLSLVQIHLQISNAWKPQHTLAIGIRDVKIHTRKIRTRAIDLHEDARFGKFATRRAFCVAYSCNEATGQHNTSVSSRILQIWLLLLPPFPFAATFCSHCLDMQDEALVLCCLFNGTKHQTHIAHTHTHTHIVTQVHTLCFKILFMCLQHAATHCNTLQHTATYCDTLQHTATHYCCLFM